MRVSLICIASTSCALATARELPLRLCRRAIFLSEPEQAVLLASSPLSARLAPPATRAAMSTSTSAPSTGAAAPASSTAPPPPSDSPAEGQKCANGCGKKAGTLACPKCKECVPLSAIFCTPRGFGREEGGAEGAWSDEDGRRLSQPSNTMERAGRADSPVLCSQTRRSGPVLLLTAVLRQELCVAVLLASAPARLTAKR